ncbi:MAG: RNA-directed DNA polymerase, partial [Myxococcota bacterium]
VRMLRAAIKNRELGRTGEESLDELHGLAAHVYMTDPKKGRDFLARIAALKGREGPAAAKSDANSS